MSRKKLASLFVGVLLVCTLTSCNSAPPVITEPPKGERTSGPLGQAIACAEARRLGRKEIFCND